MWTVKNLPKDLVGVDTSGRGTSLGNERTRRVAFEMDGQATIEAITSFVWIDFR